MIIRLDSFSKQILNILYILSYINLSDDCHVKICKFTALFCGSFCQIYRVTDEALIAETAEWPNFFLMNVFFVLKRSKFLLLFLITAAGCCAVWQPLKISPNSSIVQIIFYFWSFEIMEYILRTRK